MKIIIVGAGEVGKYLSQIFSERGEDVTVIENSEVVAKELDDSLDVRVFAGNGASASVLQNAGIKNCDYFLAMTADDQLNLVSCTIASKLGADCAICRIHDQVYAEKSIVNYQEYFNIDMLLNPDALCAVEFAKLIRNPERVAVEDFARGEIEVKRFEISEGAKVLGKTLRDIKLPQDVRVGYIQRGGKMFVASAETEFREGDLITAFGSPEALFEHRKLFLAEKTSSNASVVIYGATEIAISLIRLLSSSRFRIRVIDPSIARCKDVAEKFPNISVIHGNATSLRLMEEEQVGSADYFVACTREDEDNIMTCLQAKKLGVKHVQLTINKPDYEAVLNNMKDVMGLDLVVSPRKATASEVLRYTTGGKFVKVGKLDDENVEIVEVRVSAKSESVGKKIAEANLPTGCIIAALMHKSYTKVPGANDTISAGDRLIVISSKEKIKKVVSLLA